MNIPINLFMWSVAFLPIVVLLVLMIKFSWGATEAAPMGLLVTVFVGITLYKADAKLLAAEATKGIWNSFIIILIILTAILLYQVAEEANALLAIRDGMRKLLPNELLLVLAMGWIFESFLQGITGFGVPVAVGAPLLMGIGVFPLWAVILPLLGQAWGNTFGTLAAAWDSLAMTTNLSAGSDLYLKTVLWAGIFLWAWNLFTGLIICWFYGKGKALKKGLPAVIIMSIIQGGGQLFLGQINTTLSCFIPSCISLVVFMLLGKTKRYKEEWRIEDSPIMNRQQAQQEEHQEKSSMSLLQAFMPYIALSVIALVILLVKPLKDTLEKVSIGFAIPETVTGYGFVNKAIASYSPLKPFTHASMFLLVAALIGLAYYRKHNFIKKGATKKVFIKSISMSMPSSIAVIGLIIMSDVMSGTGQTMVLANGIASLLGKGYIILAPFVGVLGSFMTGSNVSSNILFGNFQLTTSNLLQLNVAQILGAQTTGGSIGSAISSSKIVLGTTTANILGSEGLVLKKIIAVAVIPALILGVMLFITAMLF